MCIFFYLFYLTVLIYVPLIDGLKCAVCEYMNDAEDGETVRTCDDSCHGNLCYIGK